MLGWKLIHSTARFGARFLLIAVVLQIAACISLPTIHNSSDPGVEGSATQLDRFAGIFFLRSASFVTGTAPTHEGQQESTSCKSDDAIANVVWRDQRISLDNANQVCTWLLSAVSYVGGLAKIPDPPKRAYELSLVYEDTGHSESKFSWFPLGTLRPVYVAYWYPNDRAKGRAHVVDTVAHENTHLYSQLLDRQTNEAVEEQMGYLAGICAQLQITGQIRERDLSRRKLDKSNVRGEAATSSEIGVETTSSLNQLFENGIVNLDSINGRNLSSRCDRQLTRYFQPTAPNRSP